MDASQGRELTASDLGGRRVVVVAGDLTAQAVDAIVNAANERLQHGGGVSAALARGGGPEVQEASERWVEANGPLGPGRAALTTAGALPARALVHVVGPRYRDGQDNEGMLRQAVRAALDAADAAEAASVALPAISTGVFGYPRAEASRVIADEARTWLRSGPRYITEIRLVGFDDAAARDFADGL